MSARIFQSDTRQNNQYIKCEDLTVRGVCELEDTGSIPTAGKITLPALTTFQQATSTGTNITITGNPQQFIVETFDGSIAAGASAVFQVFNTSIVADKTLVLCSNGLSDNTLLDVNSFVTYATNGAFIITRHNTGSVAAAGKQKIIVKLIQTK
tara:strand:- start:503 stop:961 length:459 start_codon:yes stop_codon:yes gene_type:complete